MLGFWSNNGTPSLFFGTSDNVSISEHQKHCKSKDSTCIIT